MALLDEFRSRAEVEIGRCSVGRDNPTHRALVAGELSPAALRELARQQWIFHAAFPSILSSLAAGAPRGNLRTRILADAYEQETGALSGLGSRLKLWEAVSATWDLGPKDLERADPLPSTAAMLAIQEAVARRPFAEAYIGLQVGVYGESAPHMAARRDAMERAYGVTGKALEYFSVQANDDLGVLLEPIAELLAPTRIEPAMSALRLVLHVRWGYFDGIGATQGLARL